MSSVMNVAALFSGGKDSTYAVYQAQQQGFTVTHLVSIKSSSAHSWMFHSINIHLVDLLAQCLQIPLISASSQGEKEVELDDLKQLLAPLPVEGVVSGAIASKYQQLRINRICQDLDIQSITPLWMKNQETVLQEQISAGFDIVIVGVYAEGLDASWLGTHITHKVIDELGDMNKKYGINIAGEGGEYETLVVDGPNFHQRLVLDKTEIQWKRDCGTLNVSEASIRKKD